jgi:hypothetical protein
VNPPPLPDPDAERLRVLAILHYVLAGICLAGILFLALHYALATTVFDEFNKIGRAAGPMASPPFEDFFGVMQWLYLAMALVALVSSISCFLSARFMQQRRHRTFSIIVAGIACLFVPLGTILGVFTLILLTKDSALRLYGEAGGSSR